MKVLLLLFILTGCNTNTKEQQSDILKYENDEVVCYRIRTYEDIHCFQKGEKK